MKKTIFSILIPVLILTLIFVFSGEDQIPAEELIENEIAVVDMDELMEEEPDLQTQMNPLPIIQEAAEEVQENKGYDLVFSDEVLLASSEEAADDITEQVAEEIDIEDEGPADDPFDDGIDDDPGVDDDFEDDFEDDDNDDDGFPGL